MLSRHRHQNAIHVRSKSDKRLFSKEVTRDAKGNKGIYNPQPPCLFIRPSTIGFPRHSCPLRTLRFRWPARAGARRHRRRPVRARSHSSPRVTGPRTSFNSQRRRNSSESNSSSSFCPPTYGDSRPSLSLPWATYYRHSSPTTPHAQLSHCSVAIKPAEWRALPVAMAWHVGPSRLYVRFLSRAGLSCTSQLLYLCGEKHKKSS